MIEYKNGLSEPWKSDDGKYRIMAEQRGNKETLRVDRKGAKNLLIVTMETAEAIAEALEYLKGDF
jgi:hypothetical protein